MPTGASLTRTRRKQVLVREWLTGAAKQMHDRLTPHVRSCGAARTRRSAAGHLRPIPHWACTETAAVHATCTSGRSAYHSGWTILDFEGEPARPMAERRRPSTPLRDVARCCARSTTRPLAAARRAGGFPAGLPRRRVSARNRAHSARLWRGIRGRSREHAVLLAAGGGQAVYETMYEARNAGGYHPLRSLDRITSENRRSPGRTAMFANRTQC